MLTPFPEALALLLRQTRPFPPERLPLPQTPGRLLATPIIADRPHPPYHRVAMDGLALNHAAYAAGQRRFPIRNLQAAGEAPQPLTDPTQCVEIMTGAALPEGATAVVRYEDLERVGEAFLVPEGVKEGQNIHALGKDSPAGATLAEAGRIIGLAEMGMLATCGYAEVEVTVKPKIAVVATGNELVPVAATPLPHQIRRSNLFQIETLLRSLPVTTTRHHLPDVRETLAEKLARVLEENDVVVLSGGVSKGKLDFVPEVLTRLGVEKLFHGVAQRPGKPLWVGRRGETLVFGLPGNPVSSVSCALQYVLPWLRASLGMPAPPQQFAALTQEVKFPPALTLFELVQVTYSATDGRMLATPTRHQGSGDATALLRSTGFLTLPPERQALAAGEVFPYTSFPI